MTPTEATIMGRIERAVRVRLRFGHGTAEFWAEMRRELVALDGERERSRQTLLTAIRGEAAE